MTDNPQPGFLVPKFGMTPEEAEKWEKTQAWVDQEPEKDDDWDDEFFEEFRAEFLPKAESRIEKERQQELSHIQAINEGRDSLLRQLEMAWELEQLGFVARRFHAMLSKAEKLATDLIHLRNGMFDAINRAHEMYHAALRIARHRLEAEEAKQEDEREQRHHRKQKLEDEREEREERRQKLKEDREKREELRQEVRDRKDRQFWKYHMDYCHRCGNPKPRGHLYCCECHYEYGRRRW